MGGILLAATRETEAEIFDDNCLGIPQTNIDGERSEIILSKDQAQMIYNYLRDIHYVI